MIPEQTLESLEKLRGHVGSANHDCKPARTDAYGSRVDQGNDTVTFFVLDLWQKLKQKTLRQPVE